MRTLVDEKTNRMPVNCDFQHKIRWRARFHCLPNNTIMVGVNQSFIQVQYKDFPPYHT